jgi:hypothetical protein
MVVIPVFPPFLYPTSVSFFTIGDMKGFLLAATFVSFAAAFVAAPASAAPQ